MKIILPDDVRMIINKLNENNYEAYAVGGCVRDSILRRVPGDWDITTSALPMQVKAVFPRTIDTGIQHGTVTVMLGKNGYEVTTYRVDGEYQDGRHPESVEFTASLEEDLKRRDFTINAMAYNDQEGIVDMFCGAQDIEDKIIRCVGDARERFNEDALRMLRAVRFSAQLGFDIEENTCNAIKELAGNLDKISKERIHTELGKTLLSKHPDYITKAYELGITSIVFPVYDRITDKKFTGELLQKVPADIAFRYAAIMCDIDGKEAAAILKGLKLDNNTIDKTKALVTYHGMQLNYTESRLRKFAGEIGPEQLKDILRFEYIFYSIQNDTEKIKAVDQLDKMLEQIMDRGDCINLKGLAVKGSDLIKLGVAPGKELGIILKECLELVLENPEYNNRDILLEKINIR